MAEYCMECQRWGSYCRCRAIGRRAIEKHEASHPTPPAAPRMVIPATAELEEMLRDSGLSKWDDEAVASVAVQLTSEWRKYCSAYCDTVEMPAPPSREAVVEALDRNVGTLLHDIVKKIPRASLDHNFVGWLEESKRAVNHGLHYAANAILDAPPALWPEGQRVPATEDEMARVEAFNAGTGPAPEPRGAAETLLDAAIEVCKISTSGDENDHFAESFEAPFERLRAAAEQARKETAAGTKPAWIPCPCCEDFWCTLHNVHAYECKCPPVEEWKVSPYKSGGSADREEAAGT